MPLARALRVAAPAKLNLFLHVTGRRDDGYHLLESLMVLLDYGDWLTLEVRDDGRIERARPLQGVAEADDLTLRAAQLLRRECGLQAGVTIGVEKRIPMGAGMGGGSSDAASVLLGLNRLWGVGLSRAVLMRLGLQLGADVPFFIHGTNALVRGIGEQLVAVTMPRVAFVIEMPPVHTSTRDVFAAPDLVRDTPSSTARVFALDYGHNDLQPVAIERAPAIGTVVRALDAVDFASAGRATFGAARMTGSGSAVFRIVDRSFPASADAWRVSGTSQRDAWKLLQRIHYRSPKRHDATGQPVSGSRLIHARVIPAHPLRDFAAK
jgi:4-diphosphocytidyl-2-C-methyl-D-erythritol kinase